MDVVNLSLGTPNFDHRPSLEALVSRATASGIVLVAARYAEQTPVLPGILEGVISVDVDWNTIRDRRSP